MVVANLQANIAELMQEILVRLMETIRIRALVLFGSWARGEAHETSDLDFIIVSDDFTSYYAGRFDIIRPALTEVRQSSIFNELRNRGYRISFSPIPYHPDDLKETPPTLLDVVEDGVIIHDDGTFATRLKQVGERLKELGAKRLMTRRGSRYWVLKPDLRPGEVVKI